VRCLMELATVALARGDAGTARVCLLHARDVSTASQLTRELPLLDDQLAQVDQAR
jgi:hypothetical protein